MTWGARTDFLISGAPLGRKVVRMINNTVTIKMPLINPKQTPHKRSIHPKKATFSKYLITTPRILIMMRTLQKIIKKLKIFRYEGLITNPPRILATAG
jgi:hypothetical protein